MTGPDRLATIEMWVRYTFAAAAACAALLGTIVLVALYLLVDYLSFKAAVREAAPGAAAFGRYLGTADTVFGGFFVAVLVVGAFCVALYLGRHQVRS